MSITPTKKPVETQRTSTAWQSAQVSWISGGAIALARTAFKVGQKPPDVGKEQVADLGFLLDRGIDLGKRIL